MDARNVKDALAALLAAKRTELEVARQRHRQAMARGLLLAAAPKRIQQDIAFAVQSQLNSGELARAWERELALAKGGGLDGDEAYVGALSAMLHDLARVAGVLMRRQVEQEVQEEHFQSGRISELERLIVELTPPELDTVPTPETE